MTGVIPDLWLPFQLMPNTSHSRKPSQSVRPKSFIGQMPLPLLPNW